MYIVWFLELAKRKKGHMEASYLLGCELILGRVCRKDETNARFFLERARSMGHPEARGVIAARLRGMEKFHIVVMNHRAFNFEIFGEDYYTILELKRIICKTKNILPETFDLIPCPSGTPRKEFWRRLRHSTPCPPDNKELRKCTKSDSIFLRLRPGVSIPPQWKKSGKARK